MWGGVGSTLTGVQRTKVTRKQMVSEGFSKGVGLEQKLQGRVGARRGGNGRR